MSQSTRFYRHAHDPGDRHYTASFICHQDDLVLAKSFVDSFQEIGLDCFVLSKISPIDEGYDGVVHRIINQSQCLLFLNTSNSALALGHTHSIKLLRLAELEQKKIFNVEIDTGPVDQDLKAHLDELPRINAAVRPLKDQHPKIINRVLDLLRGSKEVVTEGDPIRGQLATIAERVDSFEARFHRREEGLGEVEALRERVAQHEGRLESIEAQAGGDDAEARSLAGRALSLIEHLGGRVDALEGRLTAVEERLAKGERELSEFEALRTQVASLMDRPGRAASRHREPGGADTPIGQPEDPRPPDFQRTATPPPVGTDEYPNHRNHRHPSR